MALLGGAIAVSAHAETIFLNDTFETYNALSELQGFGTAPTNGEWDVWPVAREASMALSTSDPDSTANKSIAMAASATDADAGNLVHKLFAFDLGAVPAPTNEAPLVFSFRFFDHMATNPETEALLSGRIFGVIRPTAANNFVAIGLHNSVNVGTFDVTRYQARLLGGGGPNWIQLATERSYGWQEFKAVIHHNSVDIYINGVLDPIGANLPRNPGATIDQINIGGGLSSAAGALFDHVRVAVDPSAARQIIISQQPAPLTLAVGDDAVFTVVASGDGPLSYQWEKNTSPLFDGSGVSGAETDTLTLTSVDFDDAGLYRVALTDGPTTENSAPAQLTVEPFLFTQQPTTQVVEFGQNATFTVVVHGEGPFTYQWQKDEVDLVDGGRISGAETDTLSITAVEVADADTYRVVVTNVHGTRNSTAVALSGGPPATGVRFADFEEFAAPSANGTIMFRSPSFSGSNRGLLATPNSTQVVETFPAGTWGAKVLRVNFAFNPDYTAEEPWLRLTTFGATTLPNPTIGFDRFLRFEIYTNHDIYVTLGVRETGTTAEFGENGGTANGIEWVGGSAEDPGPAVTPQKGVLVTAGSWQTVAFDLPNEFVKAFAGATANGTLDGVKGTLEHLAIRPVRDVEGNFASVHEIFLDNFEVTEVAPVDPPAPVTPATVVINRGSGADVELTITGDPETQYAVQWVENLGDAWQLLGTETTNPSGVATFIDSNATDSATRRFYRVVAP